MPYTELHTGSLKLIGENMNGEEFHKFIQSNPSLEVDHLDEKLKDGCTLFIVTSFDKNTYKTTYHYVYNSGRLYKFVNHMDLEDEGYINITKESEDKTIDFTYLFYNGGTCFEEMLEEGLASLSEN